MERITNKQGVDNWLLAIGGWKLGKTCVVCWRQNALSIEVSPPVVF